MKILRIGLRKSQEDFNFKKQLKSYKNSKWELEKPKGKDEQEAFLSLKFWGANDQPDGMK